MIDGISIIIPTYNGGRIFSKCLEKIHEQKEVKKTQLIVIDSGSIDGTVEAASKAGAFVNVIDKKEFHHARTRNKALLLAKYNKVVCTVQDAIPDSDTWLSDLERSITEEDVAAAYTDQIPHDHADAFSRFEIESISRGRGFEPVLQQIESPESFQRLPFDDAYRSICLDNVCAIYRKELLMDLPFPEVDFAEDLAWALKIMHMGYKIRYQPNIKVKHSHDRSPEYRFNREVINSFWRARIMNRVKNDLSFVRVGDLMTLTWGLQKYTRQLRADILKDSTLTENEGEASDPVIDQILKKHSLLEKLRNCLLGIFAKEKTPHADELKKMEKQAKHDIFHVLGVIRKHYKVNSKPGLLEVLEQTTAKVLGPIYGEVCASYALKDPMPSNIESFFAPYKDGV